MNTFRLEKCSTNHRIIICRPWNVKCRWAPWLEQLKIWRSAPCTSKAEFITETGHDNQIWCLSTSIVVLFVLGADVNFSYDAIMVTWLHFVKLDKFVQIRETFFMNSCEIKAIRMSISQSFNHNWLYSIQFLCSFAEFEMIVVWELTVSQL